MDIRPQAGPQMKFFETKADIAIYGGAAFGGKTFALLLEPMRHIKNTKGFGAVCFRRTSVQIKQQGGLWDETQQIYPFMGGRGRETYADWHFPPWGNQIKFAHMEHDKNRLDYKGAQICLLMYDQLEDFSAAQFWYLLSRNRSMCGIRPYVRGTCNPDPDSFVATLCAWWIDQNTGYAIDDRSGVVRYIYRSGDILVQAASRDEIVAKFPHIKKPLHEIRSITFIPAKIEDNKIGQERDPDYVGNLNALPFVERERLKMGNWKIRPKAGLYFNRGMFEFVDAAPVDVVKRVRGWDLAATTDAETNDPDWTATVKMSRHKDGTFFVEHAFKDRMTPGAVEKSVLSFGSEEGQRVFIRIPQDPGQAGKAQAKRFVSELAGLNVRTVPVTGAKTVRAAPWSAQCEAGNVKIVRGDWNDQFLTELENFPEGAHEDYVDAGADAFDELVNGAQPLKSGIVKGAM